MPLGLTTAQTEILRSDLFGGLAGVLEDLRTPEKLSDPAKNARNGATFVRLLEALDRLEIDLPDEEARAMVAAIADDFDGNSDYAETTAIHDAHHALLDRLGGAGTGCAR
ncbi:MAG: hypothetical protein JSU06_18815 [Actinobacteria bacterium]|nr:hypothetical protein [Actinomycetota bacterium]